MSNKITKDDLKFIVKECLIEILSEGLSSENSLRLSEGVRGNKNSKKNTQISTKKKSYLDNISYGDKSKKNKNIRTNISDNSVLNEIFADTAQNTLQEQIAAESHKSRNVAMPGRNSDNASKIVANHTPEEIFGGDAASKWSQLAFFDSQ
jgi:hypothetical protein